MCRGRNARLDVYSKIFYGLSLLELGRNDQSEQVTVSSRPSLI